ncbi:glycosyltransferase [Bradyrhizobium sp. Arg237L]|uniref:glycosyltransferase n=1 Tax=Bradyrhizobium sp. Arg237L TaxID=3003352 RepID=UPI00249DD548|nr:glycosyltransferase [Bradyrhizobium sp. Arg237L]MDI4238197.1 glycosyltransferase [Bradyrhizobium sp. Arg237L]
MSTKFASAYGIQPRACVVSNSAFVSPEAEFEVPAGPLTIGLLSNLTKEKGLHTFLELVRILRADGFPARAILAGPVESDLDRNLVDAASDDMNEILEYRGPLYGSSKETFYRDIDVFVFPTEYSHEAEPTVVFEALAAGALLIAFDRGCITSQVGTNGLVLPAGANFIENSVEYLREAAHQLTPLRNERCSRIEAYRNLHSSSSVVVRRLFRELAG